MVHHSQVATCIPPVRRAPVVAEEDRPDLVRVPEATDRQEVDLARDAHIPGTAGLEAPTAGIACRTNHPRDTVVLEAQWAALMGDRSPGNSLLERHHDKTDIPAAAQAAQAVPEALVDISQTGWALSPAKVDHQEESRLEVPLPDMDPDLGPKVLETDPDRAPAGLALLLRDQVLTIVQVPHQAPALARLLLRPRPNRRASKDPQRLKTWEFRRANKTAIVLSCKDYSIYMS